MSKQKNKTYTFSLSDKHNKIVNIVTSYTSLDGTLRNRSAVVQRAIEEYAKNILPPDWYAKILALKEEEGEE